MDSYLIIKKLLEVRKLEQSDLARVLNVTPKTAHNYLNGHSKIKIDQIPLIVKLLQVPYDSLFERKSLKTLEEPVVSYGSNVDYRSLCEQKEKTIEAQRETIETLKGQVEFLKSKIEK